MADDFRLAVEFEENRHKLHFGRLLGEREFEQDVREQLGQGVVVTHDGPNVFLYTATREQAEAARKVVGEVLAEHDLNASVSPILRWHPVEERWEDLSEHLPQNEAEVDAEHERFEEQQEEEARTTGFAEWEVRVDLPSHRDAVEFASRLEAEGISPIVRRWKFLLIGTATDDDARALAERLQAEAPPGATVKAEASSAAGYEATANNPFAMFGGFGPGPSPP
jgi:hypothetical protein